ncbi:MAG TPA: hypothetical protein VIN17_05720, partial [Paracoccaceae bacterium]
MDRVLADRQREFLADVTELIESELAGRYFYDWGTVEYSVSRDAQIRKAVEIAGDRAKYASLLKAPAG